MKQAIQNYIEAYNNFNIEGMLVDLDENIVFENINNGETTLIIEGINDFNKQAELAATYFTVRHQEILKIEMEKDKAIVSLKYTAVLAKDLAETLKKGDEMNLNGTSIFYFNHHKITKIEDII